MDKNIDKKGVGTRIHDLRVQNYLSMDELSKRINVSGKSTINNWENGSSVPKQDNLRKLADYFHVDPKYIIYGSLEDYVYYFLTNIIWQNENKYTQLKDIIWSCAEITTNVNNEINDFEFNDFEDIDVKSKEKVNSYNLKVLEKLDEHINNKKKSAIKIVVNNYLELIVNKLRNGNIDPWDDNNIINNSLRLIDDKTMDFALTFKGHVRELKKFMDVTNDYKENVKLDEFNTIEDFLNSDIKKRKEFKILNNDISINGKVNKQFINDFYKDKLEDVLITFKNELNRLDHDYEKSLKKYNIK